MDIIHSFLLGLLQGLTEFLPISSSGHLALARQFMDNQLQTGIVFEVVVHFGTLGSILLYYRKEVADIIKGAFKLSLHPMSPKDKTEWYVVFILLSMIPAFIAGFTLKDQLEGIFSDPVLVSIMLLVTGTLLFATRFVKVHDKELNMPKAFLIGIAQAFAMIPGISRSGSTISAGLFLGLKREEVANFSFLMVIPVIAGATLLQVIELIEQGPEDALIVSLVAAFLTAFISGYYALKYLIIILKKKGFHYFAYYCWLLGGVSLIYFLTA
jgi:undecaprenyl-diphosphatase